MYGIDAPPVQVDDRPAQDPIEPAHRVGFLRLMLSGDGFEQALLHSIPRQLGVAQLPTSESGEGVEIFQQDGGGIGHEHRSGGFIQGCHGRGGCGSLQTRRIKACAGVVADGSDPAQRPVGCVAASGSAGAEEYIDALHVGHDCGRPDACGLGSGSGVVGRREIRVAPILGVHVVSHRQLARVGGAHGLPGTLAGLCKHREKDGREDRNDRDHDQQLNQRERCAERVIVGRSVLHRCWFLFPGVGVRRLSLP